MRRFILSLAAAAGLSSAMMFGSPVDAHPVHYGHAEVRFIRHRGIDRCLVREYHGWTRYYWSPRFHTNFYFSPEANCYYYWYAPGAVYLPASAITINPPTVAVNVGVPAPAVNPIPMVPPPTGY